MNLSRPNVFNDWDEDKDSSNKSSVISSEEKRLFHIYGDINAQNCADIANHIAIIIIDV